MADPVTTSSILSAAQMLPDARRRNTYAVLRSLTNATVERDVLGGIDSTSESIVINFPAMPDTIELSRRANYYNAVTSPVTPDGFHVYQSTDPLSIPVSFSLNAFDEEYCRPDIGPVMLLSIAAKLHALAMPIAASDATREQQLAEVRERPGVANGASESANRQAQGWQIGTGSFATPNINKFYFPPACALQIIFAQLGSSQGQTRFSNGIRPLGINCVGFISEVRVVFKGPWLQGSFGSDGARNMPSSATYSFTFVHQPGYTNNVLGQDFTRGGTAPRLISTTALDIYRRLYNTIDISNNVSYAGLDAAEITGSSVATAPQVQAAATPDGGG